MAGIGFELKKAFQKKGLIAKLKAYGYSGIVCTGPTILGIMMLLGIRIIGEKAGASHQDLRLLNVMVTYTLIASLLINNLFAMITTRYTADMIYMNKLSKIMPSFIGSINLELVIGLLLYGAFLLKSGISGVNMLLCFLLFGELIIVWTEITYLTAIKNYRGILVAFFTSVAATFIVAVILMTMLEKEMFVSGLLIAVCCGYAIMSVWYYVLLTDFFPKGEGSSVSFLEWFDKYPTLALSGIFTEFGLFGHIIIMWFSTSHKIVQGLFYETPVYDISALVAFLSILITTINFVTSIEVEFYPTYKNFISLLNDGGSLVDIKLAKVMMQNTLIRELTYTFIKQVFATMIFIIMGTMLLPTLPLGFTEDMLGIYRILCCGYAYYAMGNCLMLILLYFSDNKSAMISTGIFCLVSNAASLLCSMMGIKWYGIGFLAGSFLFTIASLLLLRRFLNNALENLLVSQPIRSKEVKGVFSRLLRKTGV
ncbi:exopolysaccharide Pel transporter PelG [Butyrivibrio sp. NC3005]|uniref:exopolysaccharide Pel transporter PelG n=1 Tax=Butyrivibrio sp. NC3005 TaxID=1280685 RepID=UPI00042995A7|nr:exopolysaccharide Pel transporter PelG [Butyrivibrio sp. NC3005]